MTSIDLRFALDGPVGGDALGAWTSGLESAIAAHPGDLVHGIDVVHASRPRAVRALAHQRLTLLQLALLRAAGLRRALVVARLENTCDIDRACLGFAASADSVHRRVEQHSGRSFGIVVLVAPRSAPASNVRLRILEGATTVPEGAAAVTWESAAGWGIRAAVSLQRV